MVALSRRRRTQAFITLLFFLNFIWLFTYFAHHPIPVSLHFQFHPDVHHPHHSTTTSTTTTAFSFSTHTNFTRNRRLPFSTPSTTTSFNSKPWPILPSFLPWSLDSLGVPRPSSCEAYFGNGFTRTVDLLTRSPRNSDSGGWFRCHHSETLRSSICEGGWVRMDPARIKMSKGGEKIEEVIGRGDEDELPNYEAGAFRVSGGGDGRKMKVKKKLVTKETLDELVPEGGVLKHTMRELFESVEVVGEPEFRCSEWIEEPTLLLTRFEYANVFHTYTDWYNAYVSARVTGLPRRPHVIFLDGHSQTQLEETWKALFSSLRFAKNFTGPVCFRHAIFVPLGYETALFKGLTEEIPCQGTSARSLWAKPDDTRTARLSEFGEMIKAAFNFPVLEKQRSHPEPTSSVDLINILFVRRENYMAHPRHSGKVESRLSNEQEVFDYLKSWVASSNNSSSKKSKVNLINGLFAHMPMREQLQAIQDASIIVGAHGAGLTHMVTASPRTAILEIISSDYMRPHFRLISQWKGLEYQAINLFGSYAEPKEVVEQLNKLVKKFPR